MPDLLTLLNQSGPLSGDALARQLGITRAAVWKRVEGLRRAGYVIEATRGRGYRLAGIPDRLTREAVAPLLTGTLFTPDGYTYLPHTDSTNARAADLARQGAPQGTVVVADSQSQGRGRLGRQWISPPGVNLYFSLILRPAIHPRLAAQITLLGALAMACALAPCALDQLTIKWPNDILIQGKKVAGILTEMSAEPERVRHVIMGVGLNVNGLARDFPPDIAALATTLREAGGTPQVRGEILARFLNELEGAYGRYLSGGFAPIKQAWEDMARMEGKPVVINLLNERFTGTALGLDDEGFLLVRREDGRKTLVMAGDVSLL